jgi:Copine
MSYLKFDKKHSFLDYVFGGCEISLSIAIDMTLSNGDPRKPKSLHYYDERRNEYLQAIQSVGSILQYYDSDKAIPVFGFGAKIPPDLHKTSFCFALNGDIFSPECDGIEGVKAAYKRALQYVQFHGPTYFRHILKMVGDMAEGEHVT